MKANEATNANRRIGRLREPTATIARPKPRYLNGAFEPRGKKVSRRAAPLKGHRELRIWLRLLRCSARIEKTLQSRLKQEFGTSLSCFDALAQLDRFPAGLSMTDLSLHLMVSNGATTGLVSKLILEGLVQRTIDPADQRTTIVRLTAKGRQNFKTMAVRHEEWVISILGELNSVAQVELLRNLGKLKTLLKSHEFDV